MSTTVPTANLTGTVTAENDPNHLLGRPHEYTSKVTFSDSWVPAVQVTGADPGDVERGGAIEAFANPADAEARAAYIRGVAESLRPWPSTTTSTARYSYASPTTSPRSRPHSTSRPRPLSTEPRRNSHNAAPRWSSGFRRHPPRGAVLLASPQEQ